MLLFCQAKRKSLRPVCVLPSRTLGVWTLPRARSQPDPRAPLLLLLLCVSRNRTFGPKVSNELPRSSSSLERHEREVFSRGRGGDGLHRRAAAAAQEPERLAELERRLLEGHGAHVREEDDDPGRPEPGPEPRGGEPAGPQAAEPGRGAGAAAEGDGGSAAAGHVPAVPAVVAPRVHPGVQGQLPGPERRLQPQPDGERLLRRGRRVLPRERHHPHRGAAGRGGRRRHSGQERERYRQRRQLGLFSRHHLRPHSQHLSADGKTLRGE